MGSVFKLDEGLKISFRWKLRFMISMNKWDSVGVLDD